MAKEDLYKTARQSAKLFKLVQEGQELESWVSKKITKAAADIESVYQYLNFEKHFNEQEKAIMSNTSISEATREELRGKLLEAKAKVAAMKKKAAKEKSEKMDENAFDTKAKGEMKVGDTKKTRTGELTKTSTGVVHKNTSYHDDGEAEDKSGKGIKSHAKAKSASEKKAEAPALKKSKTGTWGMENGEKFDNRKVSEAKAKCSCEEKGKAKCPVHGKMDEAKDRVMTRAAKGVMKYGKDGMQALAKAGKEGKDLDKVRNKYDKYDEAKELKGGQKKLDQNHNGHLDSDDFAKLRAKKKVKEAIARAQAILEEGKKKSSGKKPAWLEKAEVEAEEKEGKKVSKAEEKKVGIVKESTEFDRMKTLMTRLNG
jgi:hypothetical protein